MRFTTDNSDLARVRFLQQTAFHTNAANPFTLLAMNPLPLLARNPFLVSGAEPKVA